MSDIYWTSELVRETFIKFFEQKHHTRVQSASLVPHEDNSLLFTNSGMVQFKPIFLNTIDPMHPKAALKKAVNSQKCIRAGGKHNDLDDVGKDTYHHTFFEMLGNWSFADYFQPDAIAMAWELLTKVYKLDPKRMYVTYFSGDESDKLPADLISKNLWAQYLPSHHILPFGRKENFWEMGATGPCGFCSEIHYNCTLETDFDASVLVNADSPKVIEIWNLVFISFNRESDGTLTSLASKHVDTGMGLERLVSILQQKSSNYDTDIFAPILNKICEITGMPKYLETTEANNVNNENNVNNVAYRIIADHIRTLVFAIADGVELSHYGRGYVLRRILRRAIRTGEHYLKARDGFLCELVDVVIDKFHQIYPELKTFGQLIKSTIEQEEKQFQGTLKKGKPKFEKICQKYQSGDVIENNDVMLFYESYGFPIDLIEIMANDKNLKINIAECNIQKNKSIDTKKCQQSKSINVNVNVNVTTLQQHNIQITDKHYYQEPNICTLSDAVVQYVWTSNIDDSVAIVLDKTIFYPEIGGPLSDSGTMNNLNLLITIDNVEIIAGYIIHYGHQCSGKIQIGDIVRCKINQQQRKMTVYNHTATHLLNYALRSLGIKTEQEGSMICAQKMHFDYLTRETLTNKQIKQIEEIINRIIQNNYQIYSQELLLSDAININGIRYDCHELYPEIVRVVSIGVDILDVIKDKQNSMWLNYSIEICGGIHANNTSELESFVIIGDDNIRTNIRRITAITSNDITSILFSNVEKLSTQLTDLVKGSDNEKYNKFMTDFNANHKLMPLCKKMEMKVEIINIEQQIKQQNKKNIIEKKELANVIIKDITDDKIIVRFVSNTNHCQLADMCASITKNRDIAIMLFSIDYSKQKILVATNSKIKIAADAWIKNFIAEIGNKTNSLNSLATGKAGGTKYVAQGFIPINNDVIQTDNLIEIAKRIAYDNLK